MAGIELKEMVGMTNKQSKRLETLARIDELDMTLEHTTDEETIRWIAEQKAELRELLKTL